jgi:hypothetical protein
MSLRTAANTSTTVIHFRVHMAAKLTLANPDWVFDSPGMLSDDAKDRFKEIVARIASQAKDAQDVFEHFKSLFGLPPAHRSRVGARTSASLSSTWASG